jgi:L-fuconolactonase
VRQDGQVTLLDAHLHLWNPADLPYGWLTGPLTPHFAAGELRAARASEAGERAVFVQAGTAPSDYLDEVRWVSSIAAGAGVVAIVAGAQLDSPALDDHLAALAGEPLVVGVRQLLQDEPDGLARTADFLAGARLLARRGWTFDACVRAHQIGDVSALAAAVPDLPIVLDHLGKPPIGSAGKPVAPTPAWRQDIGELAAHPQVFCKLSGMPAETAGRWSDEQVEPYLDAVADAFGPDRLMWGSDWPVSAVVGSGERGVYDPRSRAAWFRTVRAWALRRGLDLPPLFSSTAARFYGIPAV